MERAHPGALASQWIPEDPALWRLERFRDFLVARQALLADELNRQMEALLHGDTRWLEGGTPRPSEPAIVVGGISNLDEEAELEALNQWVAACGLPRGQLAYDYADPLSGQQVAVFDLAWPAGLQEELSQPVAILLNEEPSTIALASQAGFRCFTDAQAFRHYVERDVLATQPQ